MPGRPMATTTSTANSTIGSVMQARRIGTRDPA
jgi:hypothetical protein